LILLSGAREPTREEVDSFNVKNLSSSDRLGNHTLCI